MEKLVLIAAAALSAATLGTAAIAQDATTDFEKADANNDGFVTWEEALAVYPTLAQNLFTQADDDADGSLDEAEFTALVGLTAGAGDSGSTTSSAM